MVEEEIKPFAPAAGAEVSDEPAPPDGFHALDSRVIIVWRLSSLIGIAFLLLSMLIFVVVVALKDPQYLRWLAGSWLLISALFGWFCFWYPPRYYRSWSYRIDERVLETRSGRLVQRTRLLPLSRLQHVDIERGPLERAFGLASLVLHTAGTHSANIRIPGLEASEATRLRDRLIEIGGDDAV